MNRAKHQDQAPQATGEPEPTLGAQPPPADVDERIAQLTAERDEAHQKYLHALADFQNYQRRALLNEQEARRQGITAVLMSIMPVIDHFDVALKQPVTSPQVEAVMEGVKAIRAELLRALEMHGVTPINPQPGDEFDPTRHQAMIHGPAGDSGVEPGRISATLQAGYALGDRVIRPAKVSVASEG